MVSQVNAIQNRCDPPDEGEVVIASWLREFWHQATGASLLTIEINKPLSLYGDLPASLRSLTLQAPILHRVIRSGMAMMPANSIQTYIHGEHFYKAVAQISQTWNYSPKASSQGQSLAQITGMRADLRSACQLALNTVKVSSRAGLFTEAVFRGTQSKLLDHRDLDALLQCATHGKLASETAVEAIRLGHTAGSLHRRWDRVALNSLCQVMSTGRFIMSSCDTFRSAVRSLKMLMA